MRRRSISNEEFSKNSKRWVVGGWIKRHHCLPPLETQFLFHPDTAHSTDIATKWQLDLSRVLRNTHGFGTLSFSWGQAWLLPLSTKVKILLHAISSITTTLIFPPHVPKS